MSSKPAGPPLTLDDDLLDSLLEMKESHTFEVKRVGDNKRALETIVAFANASGGHLVLGVEDPAKASGRDRVYGIQEKPEAVDELQRLARNRITPPLAAPDSLPLTFTEVGCTLRDGSHGSIFVVRVAKSGAVHSLVDGGTLVRLERSNRHLSAAEITDLSMQRGTTSAVGALAEVDFDLLNTHVWQAYAEQRRLTRGIADAMYHLGLARQTPDRQLRPTRAAVLLFAEDPSGLLDMKYSCRIFQYRGERIEHGTETNLLRPPKTVSGPLATLIRDALTATVDALASGVQMGPLGFEVVQKYPLRVLREAITNAIVHRDYRLSVDIQIRVFANRIEIESPGLFPADVTVANIGDVGSRPRNRAIVDHLREFPHPPNLDAGEGVRMMIETMGRATLYPPLFVTRPECPREAVNVILMNEAPPSAWKQVEQYLLAHPDIGNAEVRSILGSEDLLRASKLLKLWVERGLLVVVNPSGGKRNRRYCRAGIPPEQPLFSMLDGRQT